MLAAIRGARKNITFETYIYWSGDDRPRVRRCAGGAGARRRQGARAARLGRQPEDRRTTLLDEMKAAGVEVQRYHPLRWYHLGRMNNRTHRKLLVVDGRVGFTGGVGIADHWAGNAQHPDHWRDSHYRLEGPAVAQMQAAFIDNWIKTTGTVLQGEDYFPALEPLGEARGAGVHQLADRRQREHAAHVPAVDRRRGAHDRPVRGLFRARRSDASALRAALERGVRVRIIVPGRAHRRRVVRKASRAQLGRAAGGGRRDLRIPADDVPLQVLIVDGCMVSVGSTNFDNRSFRLNDEANLNVYDRALPRRDRRFRGGQAPRPAHHACRMAQAALADQGCWNMHPTCSRRSSDTAREPRRRRGQAPRTWQARARTA